MSNDDETAIVRQRRRRERKPSFKWMSRNDVAAHYCVTEETIRAARTPFDELRQIPVGGRVLIPRADVDRLDRKLERLATSGGVVRLEERRRVPA